MALLFLGPWWLRKCMVAGTAGSSNLDSQVEGREWILRRTRVVKNLKVQPQWHTSSNKATSTSLKPFQTFPSTGDQVFSCISLWASFSFKPYTQGTQGINKASSHVYWWITGPLLLLFLILSTSPVRCCKSNVVESKGSETVDVPRGRTLLNLSREMQQFPLKSHEFWQQHMYLYIAIWWQTCGINRETIDE